MIDLTKPHRGELGQGSWFSDIFISAIHHAGLAALTHTPSPMGFLSEVLGRPGHERPFLLIPVGYPAADCRVPDIRRKPLEQILLVDPAG